jgi:hypothetical protein
MGGGNGQKSATARARAQAKLEKPKGRWPTSETCKCWHVTLLARMLQAQASTAHARVDCFAGSQIKSNQAALSMKCAVCLTQFLCTVRSAAGNTRFLYACTAMGVLIRASLCLQSKEQQLKDHHEAKHPKNTFEVSSVPLMACTRVAWGVAITFCSLASHHLVGAVQQCWIS